MCTSAETDVGYYDDNYTNEVITLDNSFSLFLSFSVTHTQKERDTHTHTINSSTE